MDEAKSLLASKTFWGAAVALLGGVAGLFGHTFTVGDQQAFVDGVSAMATAAGSLYAIYGRVVATKTIG